MNERCVYGGTSTSHPFLQLSDNLFTYSEGRSWYATVYGHTGALLRRDGARYPWVHVEGGGVVSDAYRGVLGRRLSDNILRILRYYKLLNYKC